MSEAAKDRITNLPESLLHHIHSFLHIKDGARSSVLSKRWNYIWTTVPTLHFHSDQTFSNSEIEKFMDFVDGTLHRHKLSNVDKFSLTCSESSDQLKESRFHSWISNVIKGSVKELSLDICQQDPLFVPLSLFTCESLVSLELNTYPSIRLPKCISFPRLKRLKLLYFKFEDEYWNQELFSNSPVLEELILEQCIFRMSDFCISIPTLKLLKIDTWCDAENDLEDGILRIDAPRLESFSYRGYVAKEYVLSSFPVLVEAAVDFSMGQYVSAEGISRLLFAIAHVRCLTVCDTTLQAICSASYLSNNLLTFPNVKTLNICEKLNADEGLIALLKAVPNLESLVFLKFINDAAECKSNIGESEDNFDDEDDSWMLDIVTAGCLLPHLRSVCFQVSVGNPRELKWVRLILREAKALETMTIRYYDCHARSVNARSEKELMVKIPSFPRASSGCVIKFYSRDWKLVAVH